MPELINFETCFLEGIPANPIVLLDSAFNAASIWLDGLDKVYILNASTGTESYSTWRGLKTVLPTLAKDDQLFVYPNARHSREHHNSLGFSTSGNRAIISVTAAVEDVRRYSLTIVEDWIWEYYTAHHKRSPCILAVGSELELDPEDFAVADAVQCALSQYRNAYWVALSLTMADQVSIPEAFTRARASDDIVLLRRPRSLSWLSSQ